MAELIHAVVIMSHYHCLSAFYYGCGLNPEIDLEGGFTFRTPSISDSSSNAEPTTPTSMTPTNCFNDVLNSEMPGTETLIQKIKEVEKEHEQEEEGTQEERLLQFQKIESGDGKLKSYTDIDLNCKLQIINPSKCFGKSLTNDFLQTKFNSFFLSLQ